MKILHSPANYDIKVEKVCVPEIKPDHVYFVPEGSKYTISKTEQQFKERIKYLESQFKPKRKYKTRFSKLYKKIRDYS